MTITYAYDNLSRLNQITYPEQYQGNVTNPVRKIVKPNYDVASRVDGLKVNEVDYASQINYNAASQITSLSIGTGANQLLESYQYDPKSGLLTNQSVQRNGTSLMSLNYGYKVPSGCPPNVLCIESFPKGSQAYTGQITSISSSGATKFYSYDALGRLQRVDKRAGTFGYSPLIWSLNYSYDRYGNRTGSHGDAPGPQDGLDSLTYDTATNRITSSGFTYDAAGNQLQNNTGQSFIYDAAGRLVKVKDQNQNTLATYTYGATNRRLITQTGSESSPVKTYYVWGGEAVVAEYVEPSASSTMPQWSRNYIYFGSELLATEEPNSSGGELVSYHHPDGLGTRLVTNNADTTFFEQVSLPFGTALDAESTGSTNRRFTSYDRSAATLLDYAVNRSYDSRQGRFTQVDPIGMEAVDLSNPQSLNLYAYCGNDPINSTDPGGTDGPSFSFNPFPGFPGSGPGAPGGFLGGLFNFLGGLLGSIFSGQPHIIGSPFVGTFPAQSPKIAPGPAPVLVAGAGTYYNTATWTGVLWSLGGTLHDTGGTAHSVSANGMALIMKWESYQQYPYNDPNYATIGYGHLIAYRRVDAKITAQYPNGWSRQEAYHQLLNDVQEHAAYIDLYVKVPLTQNQYDALASYRFNTGPQWLYGVAQYLNRGDVAGALRRMRRPITSKGKVMRGLITRRRLERELFSKPWL